MSLPAFARDGFEIVPLLSSEEFVRVKSYAIQMLSSLFQHYAHRDVSEEDIQTYHLWGPQAQVPHAEMLRAKNRHTQASEEMKSLLINPVLTDFLEQVGVRTFRLWDEGLGWLGFRLIRPGFGDGYPFSCKYWGPAKQVLSIWVPIVGFAQELAINFIPGSHLKEYPKYLPADTQFTKDEYRLDFQPAPEQCMRPATKQGEAILFHPRTLHSENVETGAQTRLNLEFRIEPL